MDLGMLTGGIVAIVGACVALATLPRKSAGHPQPYPSVTAQTPSATIEDDCG